MFSLDGKFAFITGAATGIGQAIAVGLAEAGATLVITDRNGERLLETESLIRSAGKEVLSIALDVRDPAQITSAFAEAERRFGQVDILVNNAGINRPTPAIEVTTANWEDHFQVNVRGGFLLAQAAATGMINRRWGRIVFISSQSGLVGIPGQAVYCSSKGAAIQLVRTLGVEWGKYGITVNSIAPTFVETDLTRSRLADEAFRTFVLRKIPAGKLALPRHIAAAAVYLSSDEAAMVNCETHCVDGGWTAW